MTEICSSSRERATGPVPTWTSGAPASIAWGAWVPQPEGGVQRIYLENVPHTDRVGRPLTAFDAERQPAS